MNRAGQIPRSRGGITGLLLILLGAAGGLAPFVGPYFHFGYTPDTTWVYNSGRLYYSVVPAAVTVLGGLLVLVTRNRGIGVFGGLIAAAAGAWFILGQDFVTTVLKRTISAGSPIAPVGTAPGTTSIRLYAETLALFGGVGVLILLFGAVAMGRLSLLAAQDVTAVQDAYYTDFPAAPATSQPGQYSSSQYPTSTGQFPSASAFPPSGYTEAPFPDTTTAQYPPEGTA
jgi:hypothetical protein